MEHVDCVMQRDVYLQKLHSFSKNIRVKSFFALLAEGQQSLCHVMVSVFRPSDCPSVRPSVSLSLVYAIKSTFLVGFS